MLFSSESLPRILIVAPNASSRFGGEAYLPLKYFEILRRRGIAALLIAHERNRADLSQALAPWISDILFVPDTLLHRVVWQAGRHFPHFLREAILNLITSHFQRRMTRKLVAEGLVDVIHQPAPVSPRAPSPFHGFGVPVVIGPMNGGMAYPPGYEDLESVATRRLVPVARAVAWALNILVPGKRRAAALLVANARSRAALPVGHHPKVIELVENGVDLTIWQARPERPPRALGQPFRLVFMGRLVAWKAVGITLEAIAMARAAGVAAELDILGDGPERATLQARVGQQGLQEVVRFHGFLPQAVCADVMRTADALILNSVWECGGAVVLEAMSLGLPVIASDWGGPADYLDESCGILVPPAPRGDFARRLAEAIARLAADPALCRRMGEAGRARALAEYDWERKVDRILDICRDVTTERRHEP